MEVESVRSFSKALVINVTKPQGEIRSVREDNEWFLGHFYSHVEYPHFHLYLTNIKKMENEQSIVVYLYPE